MGWNLYDNVVLDLDETLIYAREGPLYARPHTDLLLQLLKDHFETVVWTAGVKAYAQSIIRNIDPEGIIEHCIYRHKRWFSGRAGYQKDLTMLGRSMDRVIIIENTPDCIRGNPENGVLVSDYEGGEAGDPTIPALIHFLAGLAESKMTVPEFLRTSSMLKTASVLTDVGDVFSVHVLNCAAADVKTSKRINRDLRVQIGERPSSPGSDGGESRPEQQKRSPRGHTEDPSDGGGRRRLDSSNPLPRNAVPLCVPMSPNGTFHEEWAKANAKRGSILSSCM
ncbi:CTD small phosphatase-like protein 2 [Diplonema papillatum]|nr:CTD small phosphatase-like protein 2 [Diplonema papillatum]